MFLLFLGLFSALAEEPQTETDFGPSIILEPSHSDIHDKPLVIETECGKWVIDTANYTQFFMESSRAVSAGGVTRAAREANLMRQLNDNWPFINRRYTSDTGWTMDQRGKRVCMWGINDDILCFEPRGSDFIEVYVGAKCGPASYSREEALVIFTEALYLDPNWRPPRREYELEEPWPRPKAASSNR